MAQQGPESSSVASSSTVLGNCWPFSSSSSSPAASWCGAMSRPWQPSHRRTSFDDSSDTFISSGTRAAASFTNHSVLVSMEGASSSADLSGEPAENHIWSQVFLNVEAEVQNGHGDGEDSSLEVRLRQVLEPAACDYLKQMDHNSYGGQTNCRLSDLVNWSIAPPNSNLNTWMPHSQASNPSHVKDESPSINLVAGGNNTSYFPTSYGDLDSGTATPFFVRPNSTTRHQNTGANNSAGQLHENMCSGMTEVSDPWFSRRNLSDQISFGGCNPNKQASANDSDSCDGTNKQGNESATQTVRNDRITSDGKKRSSKDYSSDSLKKCKYDSLMVSSHKVQAPKVKIAEKISALQQLVSPFGKTDQASVLMETITCIKILQEQVQLLSDPYLKCSAGKEHNNSWVNQMERMEMGEAKHDLRGRGLCLVPVSCIPLLEKESSRSDYWMPTYRSCFYR